MLELGAVAGGAVADGDDEPGMAAGQAQAGRTEGAGTARAEPGDDADMGGEMGQAAGGAAETGPERED